MGHIKEPKGVDFIIQSEPLTDKDRKEISKFIADYKAKTNRKELENLNKLRKEVRQHNITYKQLWFKHFLG